MFSARKLISHRRVAAVTAFTGAIVFSLALISGPNLRSYSQLALVDAAFEGKVVWMKVLLAAGADVDEFECQAARCRTPLIAASQAGRYEAAQLLLARGANVNKRMKRGQTALMFASYYGHTSLVRFLLANGADVSADFEGDTALRWANQKGNTEIAELLTEAGATH